MGGACSTHRSAENAYKILTGIPEGKRALERRSRRWGIILKLISEKSGGKLWTELIWLRKGASGGLL
jgi:hypothetical protein